MRRASRPCGPGRRGRRRPTRSPGFTFQPAQRRVGRDARAQQRRGGRGIQAGGDAHDEALVDDDLRRVAAVRRRLAVHLGAVVGERQPPSQNCSKPRCTEGSVRHESTRQPTPARSPSLNFFASLPTGVTRPTISWPGTMGNSAPVHSSRTWWMSEWHTPQNRTSRTTSWGRRAALDRHRRERPGDLRLAAGRPRGHAIARASP
jgi:hypothetical protein